MATNLSREIAFYRNKGENWLAFALQKIQTALNAPSSSSAALSASASVSSSQAVQTVIGQQIVGVQGQKITASSIQPGAVGSSALAPGAVSASTIQAGSVGTTQLAAGAVTATETSGVIASKALTTSLAQVATVTLTTDGGDVLVSASAQLNNTGASSEPVQIQIFKGDNTGTKLLDTGASGIPVGASGSVPWGVSGIVDSSPGATQQYSVYAAIAAGTGTLTNLLLTATNFKK